MKWEYTTVVVHYNEQDKDDNPWQILNYEDKPRFENIEAILLVLGEQEWEIITVTIEHSVVTKIDITPDTYMVFCKRPKSNKRTG